MYTLHFKITFFMKTTKTNSNNSFMNICHTHDHYKFKKGSWRHCVWRKQPQLSRATFKCRQSCWIGFQLGVASHILDNSISLQIHTPTWACTRLALPSHDRCTRNGFTYSCSYCQLLIELPCQCISVLSSQNGIYSALYSLRLAVSCSGI